ncbi:MAG: hypothetical protein JWN48_1135, partial [Myxococcaceae bacterium]|nr:hypothetical protein [Myxococcaceae bacterium]
MSPRGVDAAAFLARTLGGLTLGKTPRLDSRGRREAACCLRGDAGHKLAPGLRVCELASLSLLLLAKKVPLFAGGTDRHRPQLL